MVVPPGLPDQQQQQKDDGVLRVCSEVQEGRRREQGRGVLCMTLEPFALIVSCSALSFCCRRDEVGLCVLSPYNCLCPCCLFRVHCPPCCAAGETREKKDLVYVDAEGVMKVGACCPPRQRTWRTLGAVPATRRGCRCLPAGRPAGCARQLPIFQATLCGMPLLRTPYNRSMFAPVCSPASRWMRSWWSGARRGCTPARWVAAGL